MRSIAGIASLALFGPLACVTIAHADSAAIRLSAFPTISVADGRSTATITAEVRDLSGRSVPDGTQVVFTTSLGSFRESVVTTSGGTARAVLVAGSIPGVAKVTASALGSGASPTTLDFEFVADRKLLSSAQEYIEVVSPSGMQFTADTRIVGAAAPNKGIYVRYRDMEIHADDVQVNVPAMELRARKARLKFGKITAEFDHLYLNLSGRKGYGTTTYRGLRVDAITPIGRGGVAFLMEGPDEKMVPAQEAERYGTVEIRSGALVPGGLPIGSDLFTFADLSESISTVSAKKAVIFPRKEVQFHKAEVFVGGASIMRLPLFVLNLNRSDTPLATEGILSVSDNRIALNYPHYLSLKPGQTSLLRFRTGERQGRGVAASAGAFLDYEMSWNQGDRMEGSLTFSGLARKDWLLSARQYFRPDDRTSLFAQLDSPSGQSLYGSAGASRQFNGFQANLNLDFTRALRGRKSENESVSLVVEKDPTKVGNLPLRLFYGLTASSTGARIEGLPAKEGSWVDGIPSTDPIRRFDTSQRSVGLRVRGQTLPITLDRHTTLNASFSVSRLMGQGIPSSGFGLIGSATISRRLGSNASVVATYDFIQDGVNDRFIGKHRLTLQGSYSAGRTDFTAFMARSLDMKRMNVYGDLSYRMSGLWRLAFGYTYDQYLEDSYLDYSLTLGYSLGWREIGLTWSRRTKRIGFQLLGTSF